MFLKSLAIGILLSSATPLVAAQSAVPGAGLSAAQIVEKNVAARGGLQAWRAVQTMSFGGKPGVGGNQRATPAAPTSPQKPGSAARAYRQKSDA